jgi:hypothetical protein
MNQLPEGSDALLAAPERQEPETPEEPEVLEERVTMPKRTNSILSLDDLPVLASVTTYWGDGSDNEVEASLPAHVPVSLTPESDDWVYDESIESYESPTLSTSEAEAATGMDAESADSQSAAVGQTDASSEGEGEDETQEMDALIEPQDGDDPEQTG